MSTPLPLLEDCPKDMKIGPCGGVDTDGSCEVRDGRRCTFVDGLPETTGALPLATGGGPMPRSRGGFEAALRGGEFAVVAEVNGADTTDPVAFVDAARALARLTDVVSITDHSGANVHMGNVAASAHLAAAGIEAMATFTCRDRNRIALQGDLLGVASLGVPNVLVVTGNHVEVGDSPLAKPVFDLDSTRLLTVAADLRDRGVLENGRAIEVPPRYLVGAAAHPFAPPYDRRVGHVVRKVRAGADFLITQHIFDLPRWRTFLQDVEVARQDVADFHLLGGVAVMPDEPTARRVNAGLRGFTIPEAHLTRLRKAPDPAKEGIAIAAETVAELADSPGVAGCLLAPVTTRTNALGAAVEQSEIIHAVLEAAGVRRPAEAGA